MQTHAKYPWKCFSYYVVNAEVTCSSPSVSYNAVLKGTSRDFHLGIVRQSVVIVVLIVYCLHNSEAQVSPKASHNEAIIYLAVTISCIEQAFACSVA